MRCWSIKRGDYELAIQFMPNSWSLPFSFGGGIWADEEIGDYGTVYSCEYFRAIIVGILCFWIRLDVSLDR